MDGNIQTFIKELCSNCKNKECSRGIYVTKYNDMIVTKCCDYIRKDTDSNDEQMKEVVNYYHEKNKKYEIRNK